VVFDFSAAEEVVRDDVAGGVSAVELESSALTNGDLGLAVPLFVVPAVKNGDGVRPMAGGVPVRDGDGLGRLMAGLSHEAKKSPSSSSVLTVTCPSSMTTVSGYL
jgi:hypothetical protein